MSKEKVFPTITSEEFEAMGTVERRLAIAKDILAQVAGKRLVPEPGRYLSVARRNLRSSLEATLEVAPRCTVCAIGAAFVCAVRIADDVDPAVDEVVLRGAGDWLLDISESGQAMRSHLSRFFETRQLALIEASFERDAVLASDVSGFHGEHESADFMAAQAFGEDFDDDRERFEAIWANVVSNGGHFAP